MRVLIPLALASILVLGVALVTPSTASASTEAQHHGHAVGVAHGGHGNHWGGAWRAGHWGGRWTGYRGAWGGFRGPVFVAAPIVIPAPAIPVPVAVPVPVPQYTPVAVAQTTYTPLLTSCGCPQ
jgi:hypothetical protein